MAQWLLALVGLLGRPRARGVLILAVLVVFLLPVLVINVASLPAEYRSEADLLGWPLLAIGVQPHGWISIGSAPVGFIAFGGAPIGVVAIGGIAIGLVTFGGCAIAALVAIGGLGIGYYSLGGLSIGGFAFAGSGRAIGYFAAEGSESERLIGVDRRP